MTVSRALSDPSSVSDKMRRKVDAAVRQFGYLPNRIAGSLSSKRSNVVGLVVPSIRNSLYAAMNPGGIRADLVCTAVPVAYPCNVTYDQMFTVQPFSNVMTVKTMTGQQIYALLAQQFNNPSSGQLRVLQVSSGFTYSYTFSGTSGAITPGSVKIGGVAVDPLASYRVAMNNFLASGGDGFTVFNEGTDQLGGEVDIDAFVAYFGKFSPVAPGPQNRITRLP